MEMNQMQQMTENSEAESAETQGEVNILVQLSSCKEKPLDFVSPLILGAFTV